MTKTLSEIFLEQVPRWRRRDGPLRPQRQLPLHQGDERIHLSVQGRIFRFRISQRLPRQLPRLLQERGSLSEGQARKPLLPVRGFVHRQAVRGEVRVRIHRRRSCRSCHLPHLARLAHLDDLRPGGEKQENAGKDFERGHRTERFPG